MRGKKQPAGSEKLVLDALREQNAHLMRSVQQLALLNELAQAVGLSESSQDIIQAIVTRAKRALGAEQVMIYFLEPAGEEDVMKTKARNPTAHFHHKIHFDDALRWTMEGLRAPFMTNDPHHEPRLRGVALDPDLRSLLCVPLLVRGRLTGLVAACNKPGEAEFTDEDRRLLTILANQSAQVLETARLREEEAHLQRIHRDLMIAREIQMHLLPSTTPCIDGYDIAGCSIPAELIGGDYFDYIQLGDGRLGLCLGDVSGKGLPASLLMANLQATLRGQAHLHDSASECLRWANRLLFHSTGPERFATLFFGILDPRSHELHYCNAGHERPLLMICTSEGECGLELSGSGLVLGVMEDFPYQEHRVVLEPGCLLLLFSDGLIDAVDQDDRAFGADGVTQSLEGLEEASAEQIMARLIAAVKDHAGGVPAFDDLTIMAIRRRREGPA